MATAFATLMLLVYPIGVPALYCLLLHRRRSLLEQQSGRTRVVLAKQEQRLARAASAQSQTHPLPSLCRVWRSP